LTNEPLSRIVLRTGKFNFYENVCGRITFGESLAERIDLYEEFVGTDNSFKNEDSDFQGGTTHDIRLISD